jgi:hypothetical protein
VCSNIEHAKHTTKSTRNKTLGAALGILDDRTEQSVTTHSITDTDFTKDHAKNLPMSPLVSKEKSMFHFLATVKVHGTPMCDVGNW